jgi:hypothetical protein
LIRVGRKPGIEKSRQNKILKMKKLSLIFVLVTVFATISFAKTIDVKVSTVNVSSDYSNLQEWVITKMTLNEPIYFFLLLGDGCFHLVRMNPPGYIDGSTGVFYETWSMTILTNSSYTGTVMICPPEEQAYC